MRVLGYLEARRHRSRLGMSAGWLTVGDVAAMMGKGRAASPGAASPESLCAELFDDLDALDELLAADHAPGAPPGATGGRGR